jgi:1-deoxy-D-xylulose-5-phosphate reductoisomerase
VVLAMNRRKLIILGSTGSIGRRALDVVRNHWDSLRVVGLATRGNVDLLAAQAAEFRPEVLAVAGNGLPVTWDWPEGYSPRILSGRNALVDMVSSLEADLVLVATVGISGLEPTLAAIRPGVEIALANKEVLVTGGDLVMARARAAGVPILPVDSEHNAIAQCLRGHDPSEVRRLILTASGGPFRTATMEQMAAAGPEEALRHPTWTMGAKITIDSATLMNKGFEVLEAGHLFGLPLSQVFVVIHPESIVHSMVEFVDGSILAQLGPKDMYLPIQNCLLGQTRRPTPVEPLDLMSCGALEFSPPDLERFPCLGLAYRAGEEGGVIPAILNGANEIAVERFLARDIGFLDIPDLVARVLAQARSSGELSRGTNLAGILAADQWARDRAREYRVARVV